MRYLIGLMMVTLAALGVNACSAPSPQVFGQAQRLSDPAATGEVAEANATRVRTGSVSTASPAASRKASEVLARMQPGSEDYRIGPGDGLDVSVFEVPEFSKTVKVDPAGTIPMPLIGNVPVAGKTTKEVEAQLTKTLGGKYLEKPSITVAVTEFNSQRVTLEGSFGRPGIYPLSGPMSLLQMLAKGGGLRPNASTDILVFRTQNGKRTAARFDIADIRSGNAPDPKVQSGDVIIATDSMLMTAYHSVLKALPIVGLFSAL